MATLPFLGRDKSLKKLYELLNRRTSSLAIVNGRRRIGESRLVEEFANNCRFLPHKTLKNFVLPVTVI